MKRSSYKPYLPLGVFFLFLLILPPFLVEKGRDLFFTIFRPVWKGSSFLQTHNCYEKSFRRLEAENQLLGREWAKLRSLLEQNSAISAYQKRFKDSTHDPETAKLLLQMKKGVVAQVIYRDPTSWSSSVWVDMGEETNQTLKKNIIQKNSPVLLGRAVVGVVEYVGKKHSRIRLITDPTLKIAVRALRGSTQNAVLLEKIEFIQRALTSRHHLPLETAESEQLMHLLSLLQAKMDSFELDSYLAKGVILGGGTPQWRVKGSLKGMGFNYDFPDAKGAARELTPHINMPDQPLLIQVQDILVTTGMDGVFPAGLPVAEVTKIVPLKEGAFCYDIEAIPINSLDELTYLYIIPPVGLEVIGKQGRKDPFYDARLIRQEVY